MLYEQSKKNDFVFVFESILILKKKNNIPVIIKWIGR